MFPKKEYETGRNRKTRYPILGKRKTAEPLKFCRFQLVHHQGFEPWTP